MTKAMTKAEAIAYIPELGDDHNMIFAWCAQFGIIPLSEGRYIEAKCSTYQIEDLLMLADLRPNRTIQDAWQRNQAIYPGWFTYNDENGFCEFTQDKFLEAFQESKHLTKHQGQWLMDGSAVTWQDVQNSLRRSLSLIRQDPGKFVPGAYASLKAMVKDDEPEKKNRGRMTRPVLSNALQEMGFAVRFNTITASYEIDGRTPAGRIMSQDDLCTLLHDALSDDYTGATFDTIAQYIGFEAREKSYNPVLDLLRATPWDGIGRLPQLYKLMGIEADPLSQTLVSKWLYQTVALLYNDAAAPYGADGCLVLNGPQGTGKTSLFRHLAIREEWFGEGCSVDDRDKDTTRRIITKWISELGEVESTLKSDISKLKAFITSTVDAYRLPYGKSDVVTPRHTSLCATCNSDRYLIDPTGNRRWWSVPFTRIIPRSELMELDALQLWAEIFSAVDAMTPQERASCYRLTGEELEALAKRNGDLEKPSKGQDEVADILDKAERDKLPSKQMTVSEFKTLWDVLKPYSANQIGVALKRCGVEIIHTKRGNIALLPSPFKAWTD